MILPLRARLTVFSALVCGLLLSVLSVVSYGVLGRLLDADVTMRLMELTDGLHGYLRFDNEVPAVEHNDADDAQVAFIQEATRFMRIYDVTSGRLNLLDNAITFTREGGKVMVNVSREAGHARIDVRDTGIGMPPEVLFERFFQADPARSSGTDGAGVGLSLVKWIVDRHGGTIAVQSRVGEGSTFTVRLP